MARSEIDESAFEKQLSAVLKRDAYAHPPRLDAAELLRDPHSRKNRTANTFRTLLTMGAAAAIVVGAIVGLRQLRQTMTGDGDLSLPIYPSSGRLTPQAAFWGQLVADDGCVRLEWRGAEYWLLWPSDVTTVDLEQIDYDGKVLQVGDYVVVTGGDSIAPPPDDTDAWTVVPLPHCWQEHAVRVGNIRVATRSELEELDSSP